MIFRYGSSPNLRANQPDDLSVAGVPSKVQLGENRAAIDRHFKRPARGFDKRDLGFRKLVQDLSLQTGGSRQIVSLNAVLNGDFHNMPPFEMGD